MLLHMVADIEVQMVANMEVEKVANMVADKQKKYFVSFLADMLLHMVAHMVMEVVKVVDMVAGHGCWLISFDPNHPTCVSSKLCKFI